MTKLKQIITTALIMALRLRFGVTKKHTSAPPALRRNLFRHVFKTLFLAFGAFYQFSIRPQHLETEIHALLSIADQAVIAAQTSDSVGANAFKRPEK